MPRLRSKQVLGETPVNPNDLATKEYVDNIAFSGGTGAITILDEGLNPLTGTTTINFVGVDVRAQESGTPNQVNVYIPPPAYVSHFNTSDGTSDATVSPVSTTTRYVALPNSEGSPYKIGNWIASQTHDTIRNSVTNLTYSTTGRFSILDLTTSFTVTVYDADGTSPLATHSLNPITSDTTTSGSNLTIQISNFSADADRYQANITVVVGIGTILPQGGRFSVTLTHNNSTDGTYAFTQNNVFRDTETLIADITGALTVVPQTPVIKQISGVYYYTLGSEWHVNLPDINNLNSRSYPTSQQVRVVDNDLIFSSEVLNVHGDGAGGAYTFVGGTWTQYHDSTGAEYDKLDWTTNETNQTNWNHSTGTIDTPVATGTQYDWSLVYTVNSSTYNYLIDTFQDLSDRNSEMFRTETNSSFPRLQSDLATPWDNTGKLPTVDGGTGLQVLADRLVYPQYDFQPLDPNSGTTQPDYTTLSGDRYYYRAFETNGANVSNGVIDFSDFNLTEADLANIEFEISIDSGTTWWTLNSPYVGGIIPNGGGCRVDDTEYGLGTGTINDHSLKFTFGQGGSATYIFMRITFNDSATDKYIGGIDIIDGNWI